MALRLLVCGVLICCVAANSRVRRIVGGEKAQEPPSPSENIPFTTPEPDDSNPLIFVKANKRRAEVVGNRNPDGTYSFLGIRYALPPTKNRRFVRPLRLKPKGLIVANKFGPPCPQWWRGRLVGSEDCLHLNVFTPQIPEGNSSSGPSLPVMMWVHGGNFKTGSASQYVPLRELLSRGIVVVTVQYRLGTLGFLKFRNGLGGNGGLFDISLASRWVREYIRFFGGNPDRITVAGQGSGASSVTHLSMQRHLGKHIRGIISMSGGPVHPFALHENPGRSGDEVLQASSCTGRGNVGTVRCLQTLPFESICEEDRKIEQTMQNGQENVGKKLTSLFVSGPTVEGADDDRYLPNFIVEPPLEAVSHQHIPNIPLLCGVTKQETGGGVKGNLVQDITGLLQSSNFLTQGIFKDLLTANTGLYVNNTVNPGLSKLFDSSQYLQFFDTLVGSALSGMEKVIQHTTDALFNLPAFILSNFWAQKNKNVYLYSFEHTPAKSVADFFLNGINLVADMSKQQENNKGPSHGDDLAFLFEVRNIDGEPLSNLDNTLSDADKKVRDHFVTVVAEFVKNGKPRIDGANDWKPFNAEEGNYMVIKDNPKLNKGFRKCTLGLWTGDADILKSTECALSGASEIVTNTLGSAGTGLLKATGDVTGGLNKAVGGVGSALTGSLPKNPGGLLEGLYKQPPPRSTTPSSLGLGLKAEPSKGSSNKGSLGGLGSSLLKNPFG